MGTEIERINNFSENEDIFEASILEAKENTVDLNISTNTCNNNKYKTNKSICYSIHFVIQPSMRVIF